MRSLVTMTMMMTMTAVMTFFKANGRDESYAFAGPLSMHKGCDKVSFDNFFGLFLKFTL